MREMRKYSQAKDHLKRAAEHFVAEADALNESAEMLFPGWQMPKEPSRETNDRVAALLRTARENYAQAIDEIEAALPKL